MATNNVVASAKDSRRKGDRWKAFDTLPTPVRRALHEANVDWCALESKAAISRFMKSGLHPETAALSEVDDIMDADVHEAQRFARTWPKRYGAYPALAARSTMMRYDERAILAARQAAQAVKP